MEATPGRIRRHGFGRPRYFEALVCRRGRTPIGLALYYFTYSTFLGRPTLYLEDLFVLPAERGNGAGRALLRALAKIAVRLRPDGVGGARLEHTLDPLLPEARREAPARVDPHSSRRRAAPPPRGRPRAMTSQGVTWAQGRAARNAETPERREDSALGWVRPVTGCCTLRPPRSACRPRLGSRGPPAHSGRGSRCCPL